MDEVWVRERLRDRVIAVIRVRIVALPLTLIDANFRLGNELTLPCQNADIKERSKDS